MTMNPLQTEEEYNKALERLELIFDAKPGTIEGHEFEVLTSLIEQYETVHFSIEKPDPIEALNFRKEQLG